MGKAVPKLKKSKERLVIAKYFLQGRNERQIADHLGRTQQYVSLIIKSLEQEWRTKAISDFSTAKAKELARIENLERTYWDAWFRSLGGSKSTTVKASGEKSEQKKDGKLVNIERSERNETTYGDPRFLAGVQWCIERRVKMLGFDQPVKIDIVNEIKQKAISYGLTAEDFAQNPILLEIASRYGLDGLGDGGDRAVGQA
jgi:hypothetical protein